MTSDRERLDTWRVRHGEVVRLLTQAHHELFVATGQWDAPRAPALRDRTSLAASELLEAVDRLLAALPTGAASVDAPLREGLAGLRRGADMLASLPLDLDEAADRVREAGPIVQAGYAGIARATAAANGLA